MLIIGGGPGGYEAAIRLNQYGIDCAVAEKERLGGVCLNWGCIPTKALVKSAELWQEIGDAAAYGLNAERQTLDYEKVFNRKNEVVEKLVSGVEYLFNKRKIPVIKAVAQSFCKNGDNFITEIEGQEAISSDFVILATGSIPQELPAVKIDEEDILSSTGVLKLKHLPSSMAIVGGGVVGCEFASVLSSFGVEIHLIEYLPQILSTEDDEISKRLQLFLKKSGIKIKTGTGVIGSKKQSGKIALQFSDGSELVVDKVLLSVGRKPCLDIRYPAELSLSANGSMEIDNSMKTNIPGLYAIGDVTGKMPLAHTAAKQGLIAAEDIRSRITGLAGQHDELLYENIPRCTFTHPEVASIGLTEKQASDKYGEIKIGRFPFAANGKAIAGGNVNGFVKVVARAEDNRLIGMHIIGPNAAELIAQGSILINLQSTVEDVDKVVFAHPTLSEANMEAIEDLQGLSIHKM